MNRLPRETMILLVEDDESHEELTLRALRKNRIPGSVIVKRDGKEALDFLFAEGTADLPDLLLLDLKLPKVDGIEVLRRVRADERTRLLPVVILTSSVEDEDKTAGYANGANSYVRKPIDYVAFSEAVRQLGIYWLVTNEPPPTS